MVFNHRAKLNTPIPIIRLSGSSTVASSAVFDLYLSAPEVLESVAVYLGLAL